MTTFPSGYTILRYDELNSTNTEAFRLLKRGCAKDKFVVVANRQSAGRGRNGKVWLSPRNNLYMSMIIQESTDMTYVSQLSFIAALAVGDLLDEAKYKWPNDVLLNDKKVCGILLESHNNGYILIGIGVNVNSAPDYATYLNKSYDFTVSELLSKILVNFNYWYERWLKNGFSEIRKKWLQKAWRLNSNLKIPLKGKVLTGRFVNLNHEGRLVLENKEGDLVLIDSAIVDWD